ncbi:MAG: hypothetical protein M3Y09_07050 [Actinomycetota bacterium]|nr:hypothetical protein [Actinomycetota bacterium]
MAAPADDVVDRLGGVAQRPEPVPAVAGRDVEIDLLTVKLLQRWALVRRALLTRGAEGRSRLDPPAVDDRQTRAAVAQRERKVDRVAADRDRSAMTAQAQDLLVAEPDQLGGIILAGWDQDRAQPGQQGPLGHPRRPVGRPDRGECRHRQHQRAAGGGQR